ncbi:MAG: hypothetical protein LBD94_00040 [Rickettsiales bacterium]|jgi:DNA-directed RNA polymerase subunit RPC12/RpoP|nr:hypothetical protein [Rickettsiales bacterium]
MKTVCAFCKTEFNTSSNGAGRCPVCGHRTPPVRAKPETPKLFIAVALFLAASIFAVVTINLFNRNQKKELLTVLITNVGFDDKGYIVKGNIRNYSETTYSIPDLVFMLKSDSGTVLNQVVQLPPSGLIEPMSDMEFIKKISPIVPGAKKISVHFAEEEN